MLNENRYGLKVLDYEMVHWADNDLFIAHKANVITYRTKSVGEIHIEMPVDCIGWRKIFLPFRKLRRLLRLDKVMIYPVENGFIVFRFGHIYRYHLAEDTWSVSSTVLNCRNPMYNAVLGVGNALYFGEYGNANGIGKRIFMSEDNGDTWKCVYQFNPDVIRHIHCLSWDKYEKKLWIFTGDADAECRVLKADLKFEDIKEIGAGNQLWRACHAFFTEDTVEWMMDSPLAEVYHVKYNRGTGKLILGHSFPGPVWFAKEYNGVFFAATAQEIGPSHIDKKMHVYQSKDLNEWKEIYTFEHDKWPKGYFRFGTITFPRGNHVMMCCEGIDGFDGKTIRLDIIS